MCGFVGIYRPSGSALESVRIAVRRMTATLVHRGPDSEGCWIDEAGIFGLGHRRLAVEDLTATGAQPMLSPSGRLVLAFNGEIYNHYEIRAELASKGLALTWRGTSDTETLAVAIEVWGVQQAVLKSKGMFAFAAWDRKERVLTLGRDRMGEKPLYYGWCGKTFVFASELRAIECLPHVNLTIDPAALELFLRFTYVPGPRSIYTEISKLPPGCLLTVPPVPRSALVLQEYWSLAALARAGLADPFKGDDEEAKAELERLFARSVRRQMLADVPVGAFLSGGVDSAGVVSEMVRHASTQVSTFTLGFGLAGYDETEQARCVAERLGTAHHEKVVTEVEAMRVVPDLGGLYDEPFADSSQIPTVLISRFARQAVTVALTGDGGDEVFGGYPRHSSAAFWQHNAQRFPLMLRRPVGVAIECALNAAGILSLGLTSAEDDRVRKIAKIAAVMRSRTLGESYSEWVTQWRSSDRILRTLEDRQDAAGGVLTLKTSLTDVDRELMLIDSLTYLVDEILVKVDRAAMSASLETRAPYLDDELVEFAWTLPKRLLMDGVHRKCLLRDVVGPRIAPVPLETVKSGFAVPLGAWLRGGLRDWAEAVLATRTMPTDVLNDAVIRKVWSKHLEGNKDNSALLWPVLMFKSWAIHRSL
jgi:asparagine synthase (glutamine-hydrolysing)